MKSKKEIEKFKVPIKYFDEFEHRLFNKLYEDMLPKKTGFKTPEAYVFNLDINLKRDHSKASTKKKIAPVISFNLSTGFDVSKIEKNKIAKAAIEAA